MQKTIEALVLRKSGDKTLAAKVSLKRKHRMYDKFLTTTKVLLVHDALNLFKPGDVIRAVHRRPFSKRKIWEVLYDKGYNDPS